MGFKDRTSFYVRLVAKGWWFAQGLTTNNEQHDIEKEKNNMILVNKKQTKLCPLADIKKLNVDGADMF